MKRSSVFVIPLRSFLSQTFLLLGVSGLNGRGKCSHQGTIVRLFLVVADAINDKMVVKVKTK